MEKVEYWFNTKSKMVEVGKQSLSMDRLGPFDSFEEAAQAEKLVSERARKLREEDAKDDWD